ncbi:nucleotidyltransferase family protein [Aquabacter spiritensis]|uniref:Putative nucleotidyltransferase-like protein n=1 Tax=Aquabacter spiritensis TaxID=933073 RepID=A0A4V2UYN2_9HYPH|nr:nucleotidyltransferase family protein [Aquabacter spiritensis]TCT08088.1 putative nucleotidyltransferase-like protein [Aquabacter spiritensis]
MIPPFSREFALLAACCRWPAAQERVAAIRAAAEPPIDWPAFEHLVRRHRVTVLARDGLGRAGIAVPPDTEARLVHSAKVQAHRALAMAAETLRLQRRFDAAGLPVLVVKGVTLAVLAYGEIAMKQAWDIDLLTTPDCVAAALDLLRADGYRGAPDQAPRNARERDLMTALHMELELTHPASGITVELHWRLTANPLLLPGLGAASPFQTVAIGGGAVRTLADGPLFAYLCVHGARHGWSRLKWLADLNALLSRLGVDAASLRAEARTLGAGRTADIGLILSHDILGTPLPRDLIAALRADRAVGLLANSAVRCLLHDGAEPGRAFPVMARSMLSHFFLKEGAAYAFREMSLKWASPSDRRALPLPPRFSFLYHIIRIPSWCLRHGWRQVRRVLPSRRGR